MARHKNGTLALQCITAQLDLFLNEIFIRIRKKDGIDKNIPGK
jgi:hypothetical protein